jgi:hypothetical protein
MKTKDLRKISKELVDFLEGLSKEQWGTKITNMWDVHDVVAHLLGWAEAAVKEFSGEKKVNVVNINRFNASNVNKYVHHSNKDLLRQYATTSNRLHELIEKVGIDSVKKNKRFDWLLDEGVDNHEIYHFNQIKEVLKSA